MSTDAQQDTESKNVQKELRALVFQEKNRRRRENRDRSREGRRARQLRKACGGAFGNMGGSAYNDRVVGTSGEMKPLS